MNDYNLCPIWSPLYIHRRLLYLFIRREIPSLLLNCSQQLQKDKLKILDVGCGQMPYKSLFFENERCETYDGADIISSPEVLVKVDPVTQEIKADDESYDLVVHFQALEHVQNPKKLLSECHRVLRKGGSMFCTVPFIFEYHAVPSDFYRWTQQGLSQDLSSTGFENIKIQAIEGDWESVLTVLELFILRKYGWLLTKPFFVILNSLSFLPLKTNLTLFNLTNAAFATKTK